MIKSIITAIIVLIGTHAFAQYDRLFQVAHLYPEGLYEVHVFNNLWSRATSSELNGPFTTRESFFTSWGQFTYGLSERVNVGLDLRFRSVIKTENSAGNLFDALQFQGGGNFVEDGVTGYRRVDLTSLGLRVKYQPIEYVPNFSIEHILFLPLNNNLTGDDETGFADWQAGAIWNRFFTDQMIGSKFLMFWQLNLIAENLAVPFFPSEDAYYQYGFPITAIGTYIINSKTFVYGLAEVAPLWGSSQEMNREIVRTSFVPYTQLGIGAKYFFRPWLQSEAIVTRFWDTTDNAQAWSFNLGIRFFGLTKRAKDQYSSIPNPRQERRFAYLR